MHIRALSTLLLAAAAATPLAGAHESRYTGLRHAHQLPRALDLARQEARFVLVHVGDGPEDGLPYFRWPDRGSARLVDALVRETVVCEVDLNLHGDALRTVGAVPTPGAMLLLAPDGAVVGRHPRGTSLDALLAAEWSDLYGDGARARVLAYLTGEGAADPLARERWAAFLTASGELAEAAELYERAVGDGLDAASPMAVARRALALGELASLAERSPEAAAALARVKARMTALVTNTLTGEPRLATELAGLMERLGEGDQLVRLFLGLEEENRARFGLFDGAFEGLLAGGHYEAIARTSHPERAFAGELAHVRRLAVSRPGMAAGGDGRGTARFAAARGAGYVETLAGMGRTDAAVRLAVELMDWNGSAATHRLLVDGVQRSGNREVAAAVARLAPAGGGEPVGLQGQGQGQGSGN